MRAQRLLLILVVTALLSSLVPALTNSRASSEQPAQATADAFGRLPLAFEANRGQTAARVKFLSRGVGFNLFLTPEAVFALKGAVTARVVSIHMLRANPAPRIAGIKRLPGVSHYLIGNDPTKWRTGVPTYASVLYQEASTPALISCTMAVSVRSNMTSSLTRGRIRTRSGSGSRGSTERT
jgi:hypothetical protein